MHAKSRTLLIALGLACAWAANAKADMCMVLSGGGGTAVAKGFKLEIPAIPQQNTCQPFSGFEKDGQGGAFTGTGCVDMNGGQLIVHYSYHNAFPLRGGFSSYFESGFCRFTLANSIKDKSSGLCRGTVVTSPDSGFGRVAGFHTDGQIFACDVDVPSGFAP